ncbi:MAG: TonB-dependent receptor [Thermaurantiacus tibetensis]|uniref:TonB-dependent receptor n=1 Tax=Thermaurantiacus tibetensis TaxID=2759035 RepID=UPI00188FC299|nr:TonB-dependent receptor plug domain-containing protein [Thermaurantiacus tibetensis]
MRALLLATAAATLSPAALAQTANQQASAGEEAMFGDIVVTARKREETLQEVPLAIAAFSREEIRNARIERLADLAKLTPGLNFTPLFGAQNQLPIIRGAAQTFGALNVGVFLDGVYLSGKAGVDLEMNDLERIEVVKGPQSALYGRNTFAGAINYVTRRPSDVWTGDGELSVGTQGLVKVIGGVSGPVADIVRVRLAGYYRETDGFYRSSIDGGRVDFAQDYGAQAVVELQATPNILATWRLTWTREDSGQPPSNVIRTNADPARPAGSPVGTVRNLFYKGELPRVPRNGVTVNTLTDPITGAYGTRGETLRTNVTLVFDAGFATITSLTSYDKRNVDYTFDGDNTVCDTPSTAPASTGCPNFGFPFVPAIPIGQSRFATSSNVGYLRDWAQEIRIASNGEGRFAWLIGGFFYDNDTNGIDRSLAPLTQATANSFGYPNQITTTKSKAVFASGTLRPLDWLGVTGELRYETERQTFRQAPTRIGVPAGPSTRVFNLAQDFEFVTPRVIVDARLGEGRMLYASVAKGVKTGGFNTNLNITDAQRTYAEEYSWNYEAGLKTSWFGGRLIANVAGYYVDWNDQQVACQNPASFGGTTTQRTYVCNVGKAEIFGVETDFVARVTDWLTLVGNYAWTNAEYRAFVDDSLAGQLAILGRPPLAYDGNKLPYVPAHKLLVSPRVSVPLVADYTLTGRVDFAWQSKSWLRAENFAFFGDKTTLDLRVDITNARYGIQFFANNLTNDTTPVAGVRFFDSVNFSVQSPLVTGAPARQFGVAFRAGF